MVIRFRLISLPRLSDESPWPTPGHSGGIKMSNLKYRPCPDRNDNEPRDSYKFPGPTASQPRAANATEGATPQPAELALERAQRRLDNLREVLGPAFGREYDGPRAA